MAKEEVARCVVDNDSGMCKASSAGDEALCVDNDSGKAGLSSDDALCAVPSSVSTLESPATRKRCKWEGSAFEELFIDPIIYEVFFPFPWAGDQSVLSEFPQLSREGLKASLRCLQRVDRTSDHCQGVAMCSRTPALSRHRRQALAVPMDATAPFHLQLIFEGKTDACLPNRDGVSEGDPF